MQKLLVILLAVCLISAHAFVKRDTPAPDTNYLESLQKQFGDFSKQLNDKFHETFNSDEIKKGFNNVVSSVNKALDDLKTTAEPKKEQA